MRIKRREKKYYKHGDKRVITRFIFKPRIIQNQWVFLERVRVHQTFCYPIPLYGYTGKGFWITDRYSLIGLFD